MRFSKLFVVTVISLFFLTLASIGQTPGSSTLPRVVKFSGSAPAGASSVTFAIYATEDGLAPLWLETQNVTADDSGHYTALLGATKAEGLPASIFASGADDSMIWVASRSSIPSTRRRREFKSSITSPMYSSGVTTSTRISCPLRPSRGSSRGKPPAACRLSPRR